VCRSLTLEGETVVRDGIPVTSPTRTLIDLCAHLSDRQRAKAVREGIRLRAFTALEVRLAAARYRGRRGTSGLAELAAQLEHLPIIRTRSDAEARALQVLHTAQLSLPKVNVRYVGEEADLSWGGSRQILEIDGPQFHLDPLEDARKERLWRAEGWTVTRVSSDVVFDDPAAFVALVRSRTCTD
jgi:very-short-patch-repair endonuclease